MTYTQEEWDLLELKVSKQFNVTADFDFMLFITGIQELGSGMRPYERQEKMDLINLGKCALLTRLGYLEFTHKDDEGWPQFKEVKSVKSLTPSFLNSRLKQAAFDYLSEKLQ